MRTTLLIAAMTFVGCGVGVAGDDEMGIGARQDELADDNGLDFNGLGSNGLSSNGLSSNGLGSNGLSSNGLSSNGLSSNGLSSNGSPALNSWFDLNPTLHAQVMRYYAKCALPLNSSMGYSRNGTNYVFPGVFGLAPSLGQGLGMTASEQRWVSACLLAHVNSAGMSVSVSFRSPNSPSMASDATEKSNYSTQEGAFYGNLFTATVEKKVCSVMSPDRWGTKQSGRQCTKDSATTNVCGMTNVGACSTVCVKATNAADGFSSCQSRTEVVGTFLRPFCGDGICAAGESSCIDCTGGAGGGSFSGSKK